MTDSDTLKNAELGETAEYENELEWYGFNTVPDELSRRDLTQKLTDAEAEIVTNEHGNQDVKITVEGEVMKTVVRGVGKPSMGRMSHQNGLLRSAKSKTRMQKTRKNHC